MPMERTVHKQAFLMSYYYLLKHFFIHICWVCVLLFISLLGLLFVVGIDITNQEDEN